ncbi:MAG: hypothetical protein Q4C14_00635 [Bacillota bacterium]|nr:hypothetical protein [Bacillota bacterium]
MESYPLDKNKYEENDRRKILKECAHTRNRHIEIEARYEKLVGRRSRGINPAELEAALRGTEEKEDFDIDQSRPESREKNCSYDEKSGRIGEESAASYETVPDSGACQNCVSEETAEAVVKAETEGAGKEQADFEEILNIQKSILKRISEVGSDGLEAFLFGEAAVTCGDYPSYAEPKIKKLCPEAAPDESEEQTEAVISVEADEIIMPNENEGLGVVYASPLVNEKYREKEEKHSPWKSLIGIALAAAVLVIGALAVYYIWPSGI